MAELTLTKLDPDSHLLLDQPLLRLPHELLKKNLKSAQRAIEMANKSIGASVQTAAQSPAEVLAALDSTLAKAQTLKRRLEALHAEERATHAAQRARLEHLQELHEIRGLTDVRYERWAHVRLDRLLVDYLLRQGFTDAARDLAREKGVGPLVDLDAFEEAGRVERALRGGEMREALAWCAENKGALKKINSELELELRLQQFIEMARTGSMDKYMDAIVHARKHLAGDQSTRFGLRAAGLMAYPHDTYVDPYRV